MANIFTSRIQNPANYLQLNNGMTSVFISLLTLSGSQLAEGTAEIELVTWLASRDQNVMGLGMVGFDLQDMPWSDEIDDFNSQKTLLIRMIERIKSGEVNDCLSYQPPDIGRFLDIFAGMIDSFPVENCRISQTAWHLRPTKLGLRCKIHDVFLHLAGCIICNDQVD
ncbi:MAG: hypothetical protein JW996_06825 [Candidatus Cloacimonetes bacterium]|nr:hypothetical protein [Candidatus Cloacimonadota bacterium]